MRKLLTITGTAVITTLAILATVCLLILWTSHAYNAGKAYAEYECEFENSSQVE